MNRSNKHIRIIDTTLRDGSHAVRHQFTLEDVKSIASALDDSGVYGIEISHGDGLAGSSIQYGWGLHSDEGVGTREDLQKSVKCGVKIARIATHVTEADISEQHIKMSKDMGLEVMTFLMMAHMESAQKVLEQAKLMESYGADVVYVVDSAGAMFPEDARAKVSALKQNLTTAEVGFHAHENLGLAIGNTLAAIEEGATVIDGTLCGLGGGAGNAAVEVLVAVLNKLGYETGVDLYKIMNAAENVMRPRMPRPQVIDRASLALGYAGVYSSFLLHTYKAAEKFKVDPIDILIELGKRRIIGGQEDMIIDVAYELSRSIS
jgi:4-hydroxy 2-oxovalerate aldolase